GGAVTFITAVGDDAFGKESIERFTAEGIDVTYVYTKEGSPSGVALILVDEQGENVIAVAPGANSQLTPEDIAAAAPAFEGAKQVIIQLEIPYETVLAAVRMAKQAGSKVLLNPAPMPATGLPDELLRHVDLLTPNTGELLQLAPDISQIDMAANMVLSRGPETVVVTHGSQGATVFSMDGEHEVPAFSVDAIDTVGAGDCFSASLGVALAEGWPMNHAVRIASAAAALSTTKIGAQMSMPSRRAIEQLLAEELP
ncbi:MAG: ribokinase, partial [bacterium]